MLIVTRWSALYLEQDLVGRFAGRLRRVGRREAHVEPLLRQRQRREEDDQQDEQDVDERRDVQLRREARGSMRGTVACHVLLRRLRPRRSNTVPLLAARFSRLAVA